MIYFGLWWLIVSVILFLGIILVSKFQIVRRIKTLWSISSALEPAVLNESNVAQLKNIVARMPSKKPAIIILEDKPDIFEKKEDL